MLDFIANSVDPDQRTPSGSLCFRLTLFAKMYTFVCPTLKWLAKNLQQCQRLYIYSAIGRFDNLVVNPQHQQW